MQHMARLSQAQEEIHFVEVPLITVDHMLSFKPCAQLLLLAHALSVSDVPDLSFFTLVCLPDSEASSFCRARLGWLEHNGLLLFQLLASLDIVQHHLRSTNS